MSGIIRVKKTTGYFVASNEPFNDSRLSWEASGVMGYLLSKPDNWELRNEDLINQRSAGQRVIKRIINELKTAGYIRRYRDNDKGGHLVWVTEVYESPGLNPDFSPNGTKPHYRPMVSLPNDGKRTHIQNTKSINTESVVVVQNQQIDSEIKNLLEKLGIVIDGKSPKWLTDDITADYLKPYLSYHESQTKPPPAGWYVNRFKQLLPVPAPAQRSERHANYGQTKNKRRKTNAEAAAELKQLGHEKRRTSAEIAAEFDKL